MKISLNWLNELISLPDDPELIEQTLTSLGLEVEGVESYESIKGGLDGVVVGKVLECGKHPNADKLSLTRVDIGQDEPVQIVCGAPNVAVGQTVLVATVGTTLYDEKGEGWKIKKAKIRGEHSFGMICAEDELGLGESHDGIMVIDDAWNAGIPANQVYKVYKDTIFDIGLTPNRSDATHHSGVAKDLQAAFRVRQDKDLNFHTPMIKTLDQDGPDPIEVDLVNPEACPRYSGIVVKDLKVGPSPEWLRARLGSVGIRSINNVVDVTNLVLHEMGQPLHAFDMEKIEGNKIKVEFLREGTPFTTLDEVERKLSGEDLMICDGEDRPMCIGGVFGGRGSGVTENTTSIFLESAHFDPTYIRKSSTRHLLRTEAAKVFEKGSDPSITVAALERAAYLLEKLAGATIEKGVIDLYPKKILPDTIKMETAFVNKISGGSFTTDSIERICLAMDMEMIEKDRDSVTITVPTSKWDVKRPIDVVEELLRVYGFENIPFTKKLRTTLIPAEYPDHYHLLNLIGNQLVSLGFHQMINLSLTQSKYYPEYDKNNLVFIHNTSNSHLDIMRPDMVAPALEVIAHNLNRQEGDLRFFEFGKTYESLEKGFNEEAYVLIVATGVCEPENWINDSTPVDYFYVQGLVQTVLRRLVGVEPKFRHTEDPSGDTRVEVLVDRVVYGHVIKPGIEKLKRFDIKQEVWMAQLDYKLIIEKVRNSESTYREISKFPSVRRDLALLVDKEVTYGALEDSIRSVAGDKLVDLNLFDVYDNEEQIGKGKKSYAVSMLFEDMEKTLTDKEIDKFTSRIVKNLRANFDLQLR